MVRAARINGVCCAGEQPKVWSEGHPECRSDAGAQDSGLGANRCRRCRLSRGSRSPRAAAPSLVQVRTTSARCGATLRRTLGPHFGPLPTSYRDSREVGAWWNQDRGSSPRLVGCVAHTAAHLSRAGRRAVGQTVAITARWRSAGHVARLAADDPGRLHAFVARRVVAGTGTGRFRIGSQSGSGEVRTTCSRNARATLG